MLRRANALGARLCVILGDGELERGVVAVKDLAAHTQEEIPLEGAACDARSRRGARGAR